MKPIQKDELYENLSHFLKGKGVELKEGPYTKGIHAGCSMLADAINLSQAGLERARTEFGQKVDQLRQVIHEKTAPKPPEPASRDGRTTKAASSSAPKPVRPASHKNRTSPRERRSRRGSN